MKLTPAKVTMMMLVAVAGLIGMYIVKGLLAVEKKPTGPTTVTIPLAAGHIAAGTRVTENHIGMGPFPKRELTQDMLRTNRMIVGRVTKEEIKPGHPLRGTQLYPPGENAPLKVAEGKQAIAVVVKASAEMVDGLIKPGEYVDVHFTLDRNSSGQVDPRIEKLGGVSLTLFKGVKLLAINRSFQQAPPLTSNNSVTLELAPEQTNVLLIARDRGVVSLTSNPTGPGDGGVMLDNADRATLYEILGLKRPVAQKPPEPPEKPFETEAFRGVSRDATHWDKDGKRFRSGYDNNGRGAVGRDPRTLGADYLNDDRGDRLSPRNDQFIEPSDVFLDPGTPRDSSPPRDAVPDADPDIPAPMPRSAGGVRSRSGSILRARPQSNDSTAMTD